MVNVEGSLSADLIAQQNFSPARRGFDPEEVRSFLVKVAAEIVALHERQAALEDARRDAEYRAAHPSFDEETLFGAVGDETAHILKSAHEASADIKNRAGENASRILKEAHQQAEALRAEAETVLARRTEEAEAVAGRIKEAAKVEAERLLDQTRQQAKAMRAQAEAERNAMIEGAQAMREKILSALSKKRNVAVAQVEQLRAGRERLMEAYEVVRRTLEEATAELARAETDARAAADAVRRRPLALDEPDGLDDEGDPPTNPTLPIIQKRMHPTMARPGPPVPPVTSVPAEGPRPSGPPAGAPQVRAASPPPTPSSTGAISPSPPGAAADSPPPTSPAKGAVSPAPPAPGAFASPAPSASAPPAAGASAPPAPSASAPPAAGASAPPAPGAFASPAAGASAPPAPGAFASPAPIAAAVAGAPPAPPTLIAKGPPGAMPDVAVAEPPQPQTGGAAVPDGEPPVIDAPAASAPAAAGNVESLFARIRADRDKAVAHAREVLAEGRPIPDEDEALLQRRDAAIEPIEVGLARRLKRALQDDQNDLLDRLRNIRTSQRAAAVILPPRGTHAARFRDVARPFLGEAISAGIAFTASVIPGLKVSDHHGGVELAAEDLAEAIIEPLRRRLESLLVAGEGDDPIVLAEAVGAAYREWKTKRIEVVTADHVAAAFAKGAYAATPAGATLRWLVEDVDGPCPDCDDNVLAGGQPKGEPFPTGQRHPPAHPGCRCLLVPQLG